jgi:NADP-dependent 3-hydroxy acid dehydrogenase YdfG
VLTNVLGPALTIRAALPLLLARGDGHYLITSSVAGRRALPGSLYSATEFAATTTGDALRQELRRLDDNDRIKVTVIEPGLTDTEFLDEKPAEWALRDEDIAREALHALTAPPGVEINEILIRPTPWRI